MAKLMMNDIELQTTSDDYVNVKGGKLQGKLTHSSSIIVQKDADNGYLMITPDSDNTGGAMYLFGKDISSSKVMPHGFNAVPGGVIWYAKGGDYTNKLVIDPTKDYVTINGFGVPYTANSGTVGGAGNPIYIDNYEIKACTKLYRHDITTTYSNNSGWGYCFYFYSTDGTYFTNNAAGIVTAMYNAGYTSSKKTAFCSGGYQEASNGSVTPYIGLWAASNSGTRLESLLPDGTTEYMGLNNYSTINDVVTEVR